MTTAGNDNDPAPEEVELMRVLQWKLQIAVHDAVRDVLKALPEDETPADFDFCIVNALLKCIGDSIAISYEHAPADAAALMVYIAKHGAEVVHRVVLATREDFQQADREKGN